MHHLLAKPKSTASLRRKRSDASLVTSETPSDQRPREEECSTVEERGNCIIIRVPRITFKLEQGTRTESSFGIILTTFEHYAPNPTPWHLSHLQTHVSFIALAE
jgi:hypothetical protein